VLRHVHGHSRQTGSRLRSKAGPETQATDSRTYLRSSIRSTPTRFHQAQGIQRILNPSSRTGRVTSVVTVVVIAATVWMASAMNRRVDQTAVTGTPPATTATPTYYYTLDGEAIESNRITILGTGVPFTPWQPSGPEDVINYVRANIGSSQPWSTAIARRVWAGDWQMLSIQDRAIPILATLPPHVGTIYWLVGFRWPSVQPVSVLAGAGPVPSDETSTGFTEGVVTVSLNGEITSYQALDYYSDTGTVLSRTSWRIEDIALLAEAPIPSPTP